MWLIAGPLAACAFVALQVFVGAFLISHDLLVLAHLFTLAGSLSAIVFSNYARVRAKCAGFQSPSIAPFVLSLMITLCSGVMCVGFGGSLNVSRQLANMNRAQANMTQIANACLKYAEDNDAHFPPHLAVLLCSHAIKPPDLLDPETSTPPFPTTDLVPPSDWRKITADVDAHCDFTYVGSDLTTDSDYAAIVLYNKPTAVHQHYNGIAENFDGPGRLLLFADRHSEFVRDADLPATFAASNAARAKLALPPLTLDVPLVPATTSSAPASR